MEYYGFCVNSIEGYINMLLMILEMRTVKPEDISDLTAIGPKKYTDYVIMSTQLKAELNLILHTLPKIRELSEKIETTRREIIEAITDHVDT